MTILDAFVYCWLGLSMVVLIAAAWPISKEDR